MVSAIVLEVVDGDTLKVELDDGARTTVRLIGIDTPESVNPGTLVECHAQEATENLNALVDGEAVTLTTDPTQDRQDRFGRLLAYVDRAGRDVGEAQIRAGFSRVYIYDNRPFQRLSAYQAAENEAAAAERGAWKACDGNFHTPDGDDFAVQQGSRAESAERFVRRYYSLLNQHKYSSAWGLLSRQVRRQLGAYQKWRAGFRGTLGTRVNDASVSFVGSKAVVRVALRARNRDACSGRTVRQYFAAGGS